MNLLHSVIMSVLIRFRGPLASRMSEPTFQIDVDESISLRELLQKIIGRESIVRDVWEDENRMDREALILCNETDVGLTGGLDTVIQDGDELVILPLVHGG